MNMNRYSYLYLNIYILSTLSAIMYASISLENPVILWAIVFTAFALIPILSSFKDMEPGKCFTLSDFSLLFCFIIGFSSVFFGTASIVWGLILVAASLLVFSD